MFACFTRLRTQVIKKVIHSSVVGLSVLGLSACDVIPQGQNASKPSRFQAGAPVLVALLVPSGSAKANDGKLAANLENAARLAIADLQGVAIDLRVYPTAGSSEQAANAAAQAVNDGAGIILGPLYADAANSAGVTVSQSNINVLAFSNNPTIAGGNVFILGPTFSSAAERLVSYTKKQGVSQYHIAHANDLQGKIGKEIITSAVGLHGGQITGIESYPLTQIGAQEGGKRAALAALRTGAQAIFTSANMAGELPIIATATSEAGANIPLLGLTSWDSGVQALALPGLQGGYFTMPNQTQANLFKSRYTATYGQKPHPLAGLAYDGIAAIGALIASGHPDPLGRAALMTPQGFEGTNGIFRFRPNGINQRGLAVATVQNGKVVIVDPAPRSFGNTGS